MSDILRMRGDLKQMIRFSRAPDFDQFAAVLRHEKPDRPVLFEFFLNDRLYQRANGGRAEPEEALEDQLYLANAMACYGYDCCEAVGCPLVFINKKLNKKETRSLNDNHLICDRESFDGYPWPDPSGIDFSVLERAGGKLPGNMKLMLSGAGILETAMEMLGYENMCYMVYDDPELLKAVFDRIGSLHVDYYARGLQYDSVGLVMANDDWGFNTQTLLAPELLRELVFPWYKKIVELAHASGRPAILHSCGCLTEVMDDVIRVMKFDGKHSYQDNITPVESAYEKWGKDIAILGGLDVNYLVSAPPESIEKRSRAMLERAREYNGYALGSGNSIPEYVPDEHYFAMLSAAR